MRKYYFQLEWHQYYLQMDRDSYYLIGRTMCNTMDTLYREYFLSNTI